MKVLDGVYPAPDLTFKASSKTISEVFTGRKRIGDAMKTWALVLVGGGHEGFALGRLVTTVMLQVSENQLQSSFESLMHGFTLGRAFFRGNVGRWENGKTLQLSHSFVALDLSRYHDFVYGN
jgi:hypothetical protein